MLELDRGRDATDRPTRLSQVVVFPSRKFAAEAAAFMASRLPDRGALIVTGGATAAAIYPELAGAFAGWGGLDLYFSDERSVPPESPESNARLVSENLLRHVTPRGVHRIHGERPPEAAARTYALEVAAPSAAGFAAAILGVGDDGHVAALFPGSLALGSGELAAAVERPDGLRGVTLTPRALATVHRVFLVATGAPAAEAVRRAVEGDEAPERCPVRLFAGRPGVSLLVDDAAASLLGIPLPTEGQDPR